MSEEVNTQRFLDVLYRSDMILGEEGGKKQNDHTGSESKPYRHSSRQYLAILHRTSHIAEDLQCNGDIPRGELNTIMAIGHFDYRPQGISSSELSREMKVTTAATSKMLKTLEDKKLIIRCMDKKDRRKVYVTLSSLGYELYRSTAAAQEEFMNRVFQRFGREKTEDFLRLWREFNKVLEEENKVTTDVVKVRREDMKTVFIEDCDFSFSEKDILERLGMPREHDFGAKIRELMDVAEPLAKPKAFYMEVKIENRTGNTVTLGGETFNSLALAKNLENVDVVYPYLCTCGRELSEYAKTIDGIMEQYAFDIIMDFYRKRMTIALTEALSNSLEDGGQVSAVNPGSLVDWPIYEQRKLFRVFGENADKIGVELTDNYLMYPIKTVSGIHYPTDKEFHNCQLCQKEGCPSREAPFNMDLYMKTLHD
ncbi:MAG: MarR family transcriptional regulator [Bacillota bacterium]|nr:MarR family transcriptional regulator [Bacillota bacterium]